jgi:hypothetical protein
MLDSGVQLPLLLTATLTETGVLEAVLTPVVPFTATVTETDRMEAVLTVDGVFTATVTVSGDLLGDLTA